MVLSPLLFVALLSSPQQAAPPPPAATYVPERVYDTAAKSFIDFEVLLARLASVDAVFVGEEHGDQNTHRLEAAILDGLHRRKIVPTLSLEMFERDTQPHLDAYFAGTMTEEEMLKQSRPWPRYARDYRPLVETAKARGWTLVAANVPRRLAAEVSKVGKEVLGNLSDADRAYVATDVQCPQDEYFKRFTESMGNHPAGKMTPEEMRAMVERFYWAQCVKDETMAESIAAAVGKRPAGAGPVVHYNGTFHSDFGLGTAERVRRRLPDKKTAVVSIVPVTDIDAVSPAGDDLRRADFLVYTIK